MRTISGTRNRIILALGGLLLMLPAAWIALIATPLSASLPQTGDVLLDPASTGSDVVGAHAAWLLPTLLALGGIAVIAGIGLLLGQVPRSPERSVLRITDDDDQLLGSLEPEVFERALAEAMEEVPGVLDASVRFLGSARRPAIQATATVAEEAEVAWVVGLLREQLSRDVQDSLGTPPEPVDLLVRMRTGKSTRSATLGTASGEQEPSRQAALR